MVAITLIASVSVFAQDNGTSAEWGYKPSINTTNTIQESTKLVHGEFVISKTGRTIGETQKFYGKITVTDSTIKFEQLGNTDTYKIIKKYGVNGNTIFNVVSLKNPDTKVEFFLNQEYNYFEYSVVVERISGTKIVDSKLYFFDNNNKKSNGDVLTKSFGGVAGYSTFLGGISASSVSYGGYIDFGYFGLEYHASASVNNNLSGANNYINGQTNKYVAGGGTMNFGFFSKFNPKDDGTLYMGLGAQSYTEISAKNVVSSYYNSITRRTESISTPSVAEDKKILPYFTVGVLQKLGPSFTLKAGLIVSQCSMLNVGVGYNF